MNVVYASNDGYARHLAVSLYSLLEHNKEADKIYLYILSMGLSEENKNRLIEIGAQFEREVIVIELGDLKERFSYEVDTGGFDLSIMARLFVGEVLPETEERVLYLDCDTVVNASLKRLWEMNLESNMVGAVMEPTIYPAVKESIGLSPEEPYFNSGVLLIDLNRWRKEQAQKLLLDFYSSRGGKLFAGDQDTINGALKGRIKPLPPRYNFFTNYRYFRYSHLAKLSPVYQTITKKSFQEAKKHPVILHYMGDERPWKRGNLNHYRKVYDHYLSLTPWAGTKKEEGSYLYMVIYHLMDYATFLCPPIRDMVSRHFGMKVINSRKDS
ncbi:glycosyltransferase family 8 protein [Lacrimispora algidixylanolytica]|uniref:Glycosyl transferase n=1 Tax=Lacrimispora algidixylanolytica TaxID=94868 RepID=A0A419TBN2_9FIRM|nr:glycosyltransferase family 8 protein [Lacrimispora algidixylanolytica]RKD34881.1 glycosyl transferase [Lacrimispora algidixylanolytica]